MFEGAEKEVNTKDELPHSHWQVKSILAPGHFKYQAKEKPNCNACSMATRLPLLWPNTFHPYAEVLTFNVMVFGEIIGCNGHWMLCSSRISWCGVEKPEHSLDRYAVFLPCEDGARRRLLCSTFRTCRSRFLFFKPPLFYRVIFCNYYSDSPVMRRSSDPERG